MMKIFFLVSLLLPTLSFAGDFYEMGNGGFVVQCLRLYPENRAFDVYETTTRYKRTLDKNHRETTKDRVLYLISKLDRFNPQRAKLYRDWYATFDTEVEFKTGFKFAPLPDRGAAYVEDGCTLEQVAFQRSPGFLNKYRYTIESDLWQSLSPLSQAAIIMHELIYRELSSAPNYQTTSEPTRAFNAWINSTDFDNATLLEYLENLQDLNIARAEVDGTSILLAAQDTLTRTWSKLPLMILPNGIAATLTLDASQPFKSGSLTLNPNCFSDDKLQTLGLLQVSGDDLFLGPIPGDNLNFLNCFSDYISGDGNFSVIGKNWIIHNKDQLQKISAEYGKDIQSYRIGGYGRFTFLSVPNFPVIITFNMNGKKTPENMVFAGKSCFSPEGNFVNIWTESPMDPLTTWEMDKISQIVTALPRCHN